mgnify:FL=1
MNNKVLFKLTIITAAIGLIMIFSVILSGTAYPDMFFRIATPVGLLFVFVSVILEFISWLCYLKDTIKSKQYIWAIIVAALGLIIIVKEIIRII